MEPAARQFAVVLTPGLLVALTRYCTRLIAWNQRINLSGARDVETLAVEHIADAFALAPHLPRQGRCVDVGSGAGLPGLVLALVRPDLSFQLLEPIEKRRAFLRAAIRELGLSNVAVSSERLEEHEAAHVGAYEVAVSRAVFPLSAWLRAGARLVKPGGAVMGLAGGVLETIPAGAELYPYDVGAGPRTLVLLRA